MKDRRLPGSVKSDHDDARLAGAEEGLDEPAESDTHFYGAGICEDKALFCLFCASVAFEPHLAQLVERSAVELAVTERSLVRIRQWGFFSN